MLYREEYFYNKMKENILSSDTLHTCGYPFLTSSGNVEYKLPQFDSSDRTQQKCRCQKTISLIDRSWLTTEGCLYHPLKLSREGKYECCNRWTGAVGCTYNPTHIFSSIYVEGNWFVVEKWSCNYSSTSNIYALDCEFIYTTWGMEVARVSLVSLTRGVKYDKYVLPKGRVLDFNTRFSGITKEHLSQSNVKISIFEVQKDLQRFLNSDSILVGHVLQSDLKALRFVHKNIVDTSILYPHFKGLLYRHSLKYLAKTHLNINIHDGKFGHDSVKDAKVSLLLASLKFKILISDSDILDSLKL